MNPFGFAVIVLIVLITMAVLKRKLFGPLAQPLELDPDPHDERGTSPEVTSYWEAVERRSRSYWDAERNDSDAFWNRESQRQLDFWSSDEIRDLVDVRRAGTLLGLNLMAMEQARERAATDAEQHREDRGRREEQAAERGFPTDTTS